MKSDVSPYSDNAQVSRNWNNSVTNGKDNRPKAESEDGHRDTLDWESPGNKETPRNWPFWNRAFNTAMPALMAFAV